MTREPASAAPPGRWQVDVYGENGGYIAVDHDSGHTIGAFVDEGGGWFRVRMPSGTVRGMWVQPSVKEPWRDVVHRMLGI